MRFACEKECTNTTWQSHTHKCLHTHMLVDMVTRTHFSIDDTWWKSCPILFHSIKHYSSHICFSDILVKAVVSLLNQRPNLLVSRQPLCNVYAQARVSRIFRPARDIFKCALQWKMDMPCMWKWITLCFIRLNVHFNCFQAEILKCAFKCALLA